MKLISIKFDHVKMFKDGLFGFDFFAEDRVPKRDESVLQLGESIYQNNIIATAGVNASGKTTVLSLIRTTLDILKGYAPSKRLHELFDGETNAQLVFWSKAKLYLLKVTLEERAHLLDSDARSAMHFVHEELYRLDGKLSKKDLVDVDGLLHQGGWRLVQDRRSLEESQNLLLGDDGSIVRILRDPPSSLYIDAFDHHRSPFDKEEYTDEILRLFDASIEHVDVKDDGSFGLSFAGREEEFRLSSQEAIEAVLSSGTVKGYFLVRQALMALRFGAYCLVDEIEVHLNKQLVTVIINLFATRETNPNGAVLVFTTHYPELLDSVHRKDNVYFLVRDRNHLISVVKYSDHISRIENKKSEVFLSNYIDGTSPNYTDVRALHETVKRVVAEPW